MGSSPTARTMFMDSHGDRKNHRVATGPPVSRTDFFKSADFEMGHWHMGRTKVLDLAQIGTGEQFELFCSELLKSESHQVEIAQGYASLPMNRTLVSSKASRES